MGAERGKSEPAVAVLSETCAGGADYLYFGEQHIKKIPAVHVIRALEPDVGGVHSACEFYPKLLASLGDNACVFLIVCNIFLALALTLRSKHRFRAALHGIRNAVELAALAARPNVRKFYVVTRAVLSDKLVGYHGVAAAGSGKSCGLGE